MTFEIETTDGLVEVVEKREDPQTGTVCIDADGIEYVAPRHGSLFEKAGRVQTEAETTEVQETGTEPPAEDEGEAE